jgi:hypothetical protein
LIGWVLGYAVTHGPIYPLDVIRRRLQLGSDGVQSGFVRMLRTLSLKELFGGLSATYLKVIPAAAISLLIRDSLLGRLNRN